MNILDIKLKYIFAATLFLKILSSGLGWGFESPWILGTAVPLFIMAAYVTFGVYRKDTEVSDEKFADTCYYLGFIFTITSIIFSLFDLPHIGTKIQDIAVRFGTAMISTVFGLFVRVYLISFKQDVSDAIKNAEDFLLDATRKFTEQLTIALERLRDFEYQVDEAAKNSVERVNLQVDNLSKNHADKLTSFFAELSIQNQKAFTSALSDVKTASKHLSDSVDGYSNGMRANLTSIEAKVGAFADAVTGRLSTTTFPDDYFAKRLEIPLNQLNVSATILAEGVKLVSVEVSESSVAISRALKKLLNKAGATEDSLDTVLRLTVQQQAVLDSAQGQLTTLEQLTSTLAKFDTAMTDTLAGISASNVVSSELTTRVTSVVEESAAARKSLEDILAVVIGKLDSNATASTAVASMLDSNAATALAVASTFAEKIDANSVAARTAVDIIAVKLELNAVATRSVTASLNATATASELVARKLDAVAAVDVKVTETLGALGQQASSAISKINLAVEQLQAMVRQLSSIDTVIRDQRIDLKQVTEQIKGVKVAIDMLPIVPAHLFSPTVQHLDVVTDIFPQLLAHSTEAQMLATSKAS